MMKHHCSSQQAHSIEINLYFDVHNIGFIYNDWAACIIMV